VVVNNEERNNIIRMARYYVNERKRIRKEFNLELENVIISPLLETFLISKGIDDKELETATRKINKKLSDENIKVKLTRWKIDNILESPVILAEVIWRDNNEQPTK
jgi:hypothetical protein